MGKSQFSYRTDSKMFLSTDAEAVYRQTGSVGTENADVVLVACTAHETTLCKDPFWN